MNRELEYKFFREFQYEGAAILVLKMAHWKYCGIGSEVPTRPDFPEGVLAEIRKRTEAFDTWPWSGIANYCPLFDEIIDNLDSCVSDNVRVNYVISILRQFQTWTFLYSLGTDKLNSISNSVNMYSVEDYFHTWRNAFKSFAEKLTAILAMRGINILEVQNKCGISIIESISIDDLWMDFGTRKMAEECLSKFHNHDISLSESTSNYKVYLKVLQILRKIGRSFETKPSNYIGKDEEGIRDAFLPILEACFESCTATGETFNRNGKTDLLIRQADGSNIFIGECKFWKGSKYLSKAINQLFDRYLTWRDTNAAMIIFVKQDGITDIINKIKQTCESHEYFIKYEGSNDDNSFSYIFHYPNDNERMISLEVLVFHFNEK